MTAADLLLNLAADLDGVPIQAEDVIEITVNPRDCAATVHVNGRAGPTVAAAVCDLSSMTSTINTFWGYVDQHNRAPIRVAPSITILWIIDVGPATAPAP